ncbi:MAG: Chaperonin 10 Kd subunit [Chloroflexota bacterium]|jgi:co-chaperonin GroES (HSP10)
MQAYEMNKVEFAFDGEEDAFPVMDPGVQPFGSRVLLQIRRAKTKTKGGIFLAGETRDTEMWNTQVAKVIAMGPLAFHNRNTMEPWPEGAWVHVGDYVRAPKYGGDRWSVRTEDGEEILFVIFNDLDLLGKITGDPLAVKAFL